MIEYKGLIPHLAKIIAGGKWNWRYAILTCCAWAIVGFLISGVIIIALKMYTPFLDQKNAWAIIIGVFGVTYISGTVVLYQAVALAQNDYFLMYLAKVKRQSQKR